MLIWNFTQGPLNQGQFRSVRKQYRVFDSLSEIYVLVNGYNLWRNSPNLIAGKTGDECAQSSFRFAVMRVLYAIFKRTNGKMSILQYPSRKLSTHKRTIEMTLMSPRKGHHDQQRISANDTSSKRRRLKCCICHMKTSFQLGKLLLLP